MIESLGQGTQFVKCFGSFYINMAILKACVQDNLHNSNIFLYTIQRLLKISLAQHLKRKKKNNTKEKQELAQFQLSLLALYSKRAVWPAASSLSAQNNIQKPLNSSSLWADIFITAKFSSCRSDVAVTDMNKTETVFFKI